MDRSLFKLINRLADRTAWAHGFMRFYAKDGVVVFTLLLVAGWWIARNGKSSPAAGVAAAVWAGAGALLALAVNQPFGAAIARARPYTVIPNVHLLVDKTTDFSFPSDHATLAGAVAAGLWLVNRKLGLIAAVAALLMAFTRVYVGAHYVGDVAAGLLLGAVVTVGLHKLGVRLIEPILRALMKTPLRPLITGDPVAVVAS